MRELRLLFGSIVYLIVVFIFLVIFHYKFSGFTGFIALCIIGFGSYWLADHFLHKIFKKKKKENDVNV